MAWKEKQRNKPPAGFHGRATYIHPPIASCMVPLILPNCQDSWISFAFISYPQDTKCCQPAAVCSVSHLLFLFYLPLCLSLFLCVSPWKKKKKTTRQVWQEKRQMARMTGETFWKEEMKIKRCEEQDESSKRAHTYPYTYCLLSTVLYALCQGHKLQLCRCIHTHTHTHTQCTRLV